MPKVGFKSLNSTDKINELLTRYMGPVMGRVQREIRVAANLVNLLLSDQSDPIIKLKFRLFQLSLIFSKLREY
jgi:hypothetical protein